MGETLEMVAHWWGLDTAKLGLVCVRGACRPEVVDILACGGEDLRLNVANQETKFVRTP